MHRYHLLFLAIATALAAGFFTPTDAAADLILDAKSGGAGTLSIPKLTADANNGSAGAALTLGQAYTKGTGVTADAQIAEKWFMKAIALGNKSAGTQLGLLYLNTSDKGKDIERATKGLQILRASTFEQGDANLILGRLHINGQYVPKSFEKAEASFRQAIEMGAMDGYYYLGLMYAGDLGFESKIESEKALEFLSLSSDSGNFAATQALVKMLREGTRVKKDESRAFQVMDKAARRGNIEAQIFLAEFYETGSGVDPDPAKAAELFLTAAEAGNGSAQHKVGLLYQQDDGSLEKDLAASRQWLEKAAQQGVLEAQFNLALLLDSQETLTRDEEHLAAKYLIAAATSNHVKAQDLLGAWYRDNRHVPQDFLVASSWFRRASDAGNLDSTINLAQVIEITSKDSKALQPAFKLYLDTANAGHPVAHFHVARLLVSGRLGRQDFVTAYAHLLVAAEAGVSLPSESLPQLEARLSEVQIAQAQAIKAKLKIIE